HPHECVDTLRALDSPPEKLGERHERDGNAAVRETRGQMTRLAPQFPFLVRVVAEHGKGQVIMDLEARRVWRKLALQPLNALFERAQVRRPPSHDPKSRSGLPNRRRDN